MTLRGMLYKAAKVLGDAQAVKTGRIGQRYANRSIASFVNRFYLRSKKK